MLQQALGSHRLERRELRQLWRTAGDVQITELDAFVADEDLRRPGNQTWVILTAVGIGSFFVLTIRAVQTNLVREFNDQIGATSPDLVSLDLQPRRDEYLREALAEIAVREEYEAQAARSYTTASSISRGSRP